MAIHKLLSMFHGLVDIAHPHFGTLFAVLGAVVMVGIVFFIVWQRRLVKSYEEELLCLQELLRGMRSSNKLEDNLTQVLNAVGKVVPAPYLACYVMDEQTNRFMLRAVSHPYDGFSSVGPSYSGLALPNQEAYVPPMTIDDPGQDDSVFTGKSGTFHALTFVTRERLALVHLVTVEKVSDKVQRKIVNLLREVEGVADDLVYSEREKVRADLTAFADAAVRQVAAVATDPHGAIEVLVQSFAGVAGGFGGMYLEDAPIDGSGVYGVGGAADIAKILSGDDETLELLRRLVGERAYNVLTRQSADFYKLPGYISSLEIGAVALIRIPDRGALVFLYDKDFDAESFEIQGLSQVRTLASQMAQIAVDYDRQQALSQSNAKLLTNLVQMIDNLNPHTVGYSEQMMRYALSIGRQMGMSGRELLDLGLAARLSNIGVIGLNRELLVKQGRYTEFEYEAMKMHSEIGSSMIGLATGNRRAASFVLYHHERMDGYGYPYGLKGEDIPLGARIIHVVQFFLAKINGRAWREPVTFDEALATLRKASGSQLDATVVEALGAWLTRTEQHPELQGKPLARCHDMLSVPASVCESCAVFKQEEVTKCWELGDNVCKAHGRECATCVVRTEYLYRQKHLRRQVQ